MAKIKIAGRDKKAPVGPANPGAVGCIIVITAVFLLVCLVLYLSLVK